MKCFCATDVEAYKSMKEILKLKDIPVKDLYGHHNVVLQLNAVPVLLNSMVHHTQSAKVQWMECTVLSAFVGGTACTDNSLGLKNQECLAQHHTICYILDGIIS